MIQFLTRWCLFGAAIFLFGSPAAAGQAIGPPWSPEARPDAAYGEIYGVIRDVGGRPLNGAVISAVGSTKAVELSDEEGRFSFRRLPPGSYIIRAHLPGYAPEHGRYVTVMGGRRHAWSILMKPVDATGGNEPVVLAAGVGPSEAAADAASDDADDRETAWRLRRLPRGVLKDARFGFGESDAFADDPLGSLGRAVGSPARFASALFADLTLNGRVDLLTTTSFDRPQDLFTFDADTPRPIAYVSLVAPTADGEWTVRGSMTQGDISSWILAGSFRRAEGATHRYEAGASYSTQHYRGGNAEALAAMAAGTRNVGELHGSDVWTVNRRLTVAVGGKYGSYAYLDDPTLLSGRASVLLRPSAHDPLLLRVSAAHREIAPGAEEFMPPAVGPWLPPERTFSPLGRRAFRTEAIDHAEIAGEGEMRGGVVVSVRAFRQQIDDQIITLFGIAAADAMPTLGHYHVASAGDFRSYGWGVGVTRRTGGALEASVEYAQFETRLRGEALDADALARISPALLRTGERIHDVTATLNSRVDVTATRFMVVYKLNTAYTDADTLGPLADARFEVQVNQELPFLDFTGARWEMLAGVRNLFRSELFDGSVYDELLVVRPPKRVVGGLTVRF